MDDFKRFVQENPVLMPTELEGIVAYQTNGDVKIEPNELSREMHLTTTDEPVILQGRYIIYPNGALDLKHYNVQPKGEAKKPDFKTDHAKVRDKETRLVVFFSFPKTMSKYAMRMALKKETGEIQQWLNLKSTLLTPCGTCPLKQ